MKKGVIELTNSLRLDRKKTIRIGILLVLAISIIVFFLARSNASKKEELDKKFEENPKKINYLSEEDVESTDEKSLKGFLNENKVDNSSGQEIDLSEYKRETDNPLDKIEEKDPQSYEDVANNETNRIEPVSNNNFGTDNPYKNELEEKNRTNANLNQEVSKLRAEISSLKSSNNMMNTPSLSSVNTNDLQNKLNKKQEEIQKLTEENKKLKEKINSLEANNISEDKEFTVTKELINKEITEISANNLDEVKGIIKSLDTNSYILLVSSEENIISIVKDQDKILYKLYKKLDKDMNFDNFTNEVVKLEKDKNYNNQNIEVIDINEEDLLETLDKKELIIQKELSDDK